MQVFSKDGLRLAGRRAGRSLIENNVKLGVNGGDRIEPTYRVRRWQRGSVRKVNRYGVSKMAEPAVLVFERLVVPVASRLERERQHKGGHHDSYNPICYPPPHLQPNTPTDITQA
jgi:hypothetical protein